MSKLDVVDRSEPAVATNGSGVLPDRLLRIAPHVLVWTLLVVPTLRSMAQGWRPHGDDAGIAIWAWRSLTLHPPLVGQLTFAASSTGNSDPGPLEFWLLGPFAHLDPGQGVLLGSAILCAAVLSVTIEVLCRTAGRWSGVVFSLVIADLAIVSPTQFLDPVWNSSFGSFWFLGFLGLAFVVGLGNLRYVPLLVFIGSVTVDSHLLYLPAVGILLVATTLCGWLTKRPSNHRWLVWTGVVTVVCWAAPVYQQLFDARPNISALLRSAGILGGGKVERTEGLTYGLRILGRVASFNPIWASPRPINPLKSSSDLAHRSILLGVVLVVVLVGVGVLARRHRHPAVVSMCVVSLGGLLGTVILLASTPVNYFLAFIWVNLAVWIVGLCVWVTLGLAAVTALRPKIPAIRARLYPGEIHLWDKAPPVGVIMAAILGVACLTGTLVIMFPYQKQFVLDWPASVHRAQRMAADIEQHVPKGPVGFGTFASGGNVFQPPEDEVGAAYALLTRGWTPGMQPHIEKLLHMPIDRKAPFVVFTERGPYLVSARYLPKYQPLWYFNKHLRGP